MPGRLDDVAATEAAAWRPDAGQSHSGPPATAAADLRLLSLRMGPAGRRSQLFRSDFL